MNITYNLTPQYFTITDSEILTDYSNDNQLEIKVEHSLDCNNLSEVSVDWTGEDTESNYYNNSNNTLYIKSENLESSVYKFNLSYSSNGVTKIDTKCGFYDKDNEYKCKSLESLDIDNVLLYEYLNQSSECNDCDCSFMCDAFNLLKKNLNKNDSNNKCKQCD